MTTTTLTISQDDAAKLYRAGDSAGRGYAPYTDVPGADTVDAAIEAAEADGWEVVYPRVTTSDVAVLRNEDGDWLAIGDQHGPWAVAIADELRNVRRVTIDVVAVGQAHGCRGVLTDVASGVRVATTTLYPHGMDAQAMDAAQLEADERGWRVVEAVS